MKKILSIVLSCIMIFTVFPIASVSAAEPENSNPKQKLEDLLEYYNTELDYTSCYWHKENDYYVINYKTEKKNVEELLANPNATEEDYLAAYEELEAKTTEMIKYELMNVLYWFNWEFDYTPECWCDYFTQESYEAYLAAYETAHQINNNKNATIEECKNAIDGFFAAQDGLVQTAPLEPDPQTSPKQALLDWLNYYDTELANQSWSKDSERFNSVREKAESLLADENTTDEEYTAALEELKTAELKKLNDELYELLFNYRCDWGFYTAGYWYCTYTKESFDAFYSAYKKICLLYTYRGKFATIESYKEAMEEYTEAENSLVRNEVLDPRQEIKDLLEYYNIRSDYTSCEWYSTLLNSSYDRGYVSNYYDRAKKNAEKLLADENATDEDLNLALDELRYRRYSLIDIELKYLIYYYRCEFFNLPEYWYDYYTKESYDACFAAFKVVQERSKDYGAMLDDCIYAINDFLAAYDNLVEIEPPETPAPETSRQRLFELLTYYATELDYTKEEWHMPYDPDFEKGGYPYPPAYAYYYYAEQEAIELLADDNTTDEEFEDMITELKDKKLAMMRQELGDLDTYYDNVFWIWEYPLEYLYKVYTKESLDLFIDLGRKAVKIYYHNEDTSVEECKTLIEDYIASYDNLTRISFDFTYGDINKDGEVSILDAIIAQKVVIGLNSFTDLGTEIADVDGDKKITLKDAILIQKKAVKLVDEFSVGTSFSTYLQVSKTEPYDYYDATIN